MSLYELSNELEGNLSFYISSDEALLLVNDLYDNEETIFDEITDEEIAEILSSEEPVVVSVNRYEEGEVEWFVDYLWHRDGIQYNNEADLFLVEDVVAEEVDFEKLNGEVAIISAIKEEAEEEVDELDEYFKELTNVALEDLSDEGTCAACYIKELLEEVYVEAYEQALLDIRDDLNDAILG